VNVGSVKELMEVMWVMEVFQAFNMVTISQTDRRLKASYP
jgi:hypothetical protein